MLGYAILSCQCSGKKHLKEIHQPRKNTLVYIIGTNMLTPHPLPPTLYSRTCLRAFWCILHIVISILPVRELHEVAQSV